MGELPTITTAALAERLGGRLSGARDVALSGVATIEEAGPGDVTWLADAKYAAELSATRAGAAIVAAGIEAASPCPQILVDDVELAVCEVLGLFAPPPPAVSAGVHPAAFVDATASVEGAAIGPGVYVGARARVGAGTVLHPGVYVGPDSTIGRDCVLWPGVVVRERVRLGNRVLVHPNATIGADGFGYIFRSGVHRKLPQIGTVEIEDEVEIGANSTIDRAKTGVTRIGRGTKIDNLVQIGHNCTIGPHCIIVAQCGVAGSTVLGTGVVLAGQVGLTDHVRIGDGARVAAKSGVAVDVPAGAVYRGLPATEVHEYSRQQVGVRRLPKLLEQVRELTRRVERLESSADHSA